MLESVISAKLIASGNVFEFFLYDKDVYADLNKRKRLIEIRKHEVALSLEDRIEVRKGAVSRAARTVRRLVSANIGAYINMYTKKPYKSVFITITYGDRAVSDVKEANKDFLLFIKKLNYFVFKSKEARLKYLSVVEFQDKRAETYNIKSPVHYHVIFFNLPYIQNGGKTLTDLWGQGDVNIKSIENKDNLASYVVKYMTKGGSDVRLLDLKSYQASKGLFRPYIVTDFYKIAELLNMLPAEMAFGKEMESDFVGKFRYVRVDLDYVRLTGLRFINPAYVKKSDVLPVDKSDLTSSIQGLLL